VEGEKKKGENRVRSYRPALTKTTPNKEHFASKLIVEKSEASYI